MWINEIKLKKYVDNLKKWAQRDDERIIKEKIYCKDYVNDARYGLQNNSTHYENNDDICYILALGLLCSLGVSDSFCKWTRSCR